MSEGFDVVAWLERDLVRKLEADAAWCDWVLGIPTEGKGARMNRTTTTLWKFHLGDRVRDVASKAAGIIMVRSEYATGCRHYALENGKIDDKGVPHDYIWIDESRLVKTGHVEFPGMSEDPTSAPNRQGDAPRDPR